MNRVLLWLENNYAILFWVDAPKRVLWVEHEKAQYFFRKIARQLNGSDSIAILGPGITKHKLANYLQEQHPQIAKKVLACAEAEAPKENEVEQLAQKYLKIS